MSDRERTPASVEQANAETPAPATPEIPGGYPELTVSQLDLIRLRSTETVVAPGVSRAPPGMSTMTSFWSRPAMWKS